MGRMREHEKSSSFGRHERRRGLQRVRPAAAAAGLGSTGTDAGAAAPAAPGSAADARAVAEHLGIPSSVHDGRAAFSAQVMADFAESYRAGRTPNPCIVCNRRVKFAQMLSAADALGCAQIAAGHYARVEFDGARGRYLLKKGKNLQKDQSYVLYRLTQAQLARTQMPLGEIDSKDAIRALAAEAGLRVAQKKDSQDICFIPARGLRRLPCAARALP